MSEHTKTPWTMEDDEDSDLINIGHIDDRGIMPDAVCRLHDEANARHIVHCVNNHERMYKALKSWMQILDAERLGLVCHSAKRVAEEEAKILFAELESSRDRE